MNVKRSLLGMLTLGMILCGCVDTPNEEHVSDTTTTTVPDLDAHYAYTQEELFVERGENQIYGILYLPQDVQGPLPAVIYAHGYDVYEDIGDYTKDVLILHGDADTIVPPPLQSVHRTSTIMLSSSYCPAAGMAFMATPSRKRSTPSTLICGTAMTDRKNAHTEHTPTGEGHPLWTSNHKKTERKTRSFPRSVFCFVFYARSSAFTSLRRASSTFSWIVLMS